MRSLNQLIKIVREVAEAHPLLNTVVTSEKFEQEGAHLYPLMHIVAGPWGYQGKTVVNKFLFVCLDYGSEDGTQRYENLSDTQLVLNDVILELQERGMDLPEQYLEWELQGEATKIVDGEGDNASGWLVEILAKQTNQRNTCETPIPS